MPIADKIANLNRSSIVVTRDGIFDDFFDSTRTTANFTDNTSGTGETFTQNIGEIIISGGGSLTQRCKYQNTSCLAPVNTYPFPTYADVLLESRITIETGNINLAGFRMSYANYGFTTNELNVGFFYDGAASGSNGLEINGLGATTQYTSFDVTLGESYVIQVVLHYNYHEDLDFHIDVWVDGTQYITDYTIGRAGFTGDRLEVYAGFMADIPISGGTVTFDYWACNRMETLTTCKYQNSLLYKIPTIIMKFYDKDSKIFQQMGAESVINVYARNRAIMEGFIGDSLEDALLLRLDMNGNATDRTGTYDGTVTGATFVDYKDTRQVIQLDGSGDYVDLPDIDVDWAGRGFTIAGWVVFDAASGSNDRVLHLSTTGNNYGIVLSRGTAADSFSVTIYNSVGSSIGSISDADFFTTGVAAHFIFTMDATGAMILYKNNVSAATGSGTLPPSGNRTGNRIGSNAAGTEDMNGRQWNLCLWLTVINEDDRERLYESTKFKHRFSGRLTRSLKSGKQDKFIRTRIKGYEGQHVSSTVTNRVFTGTFSSKTSDYILADGTDGVYTLKAPEIDTTNVDAGNYSLTHDFNQETLQAITLLMGAEEDFLARIDSSLNLFFNNIGDVSTRTFTIVEGDFKLTDYEIDDVAELQYNRVEVHGSQLWEITLGEMNIKDPLGTRTKVIIEPSITTKAEAQRLGRKALVNSRPIRFGTLYVQRDFFYRAGDNINLTLNNVSLGIINKEFVIVELEEDIFSRLQTITIAEATSNLSDFLYSIFKSTTSLEKTNIDKSATPNNTNFIDLVIEVETRCLVEISTNGSDYTDFYEGKSMVTNRAITILSAMGWGDSISPKMDGEFNGGVDFQLGTGRQTPKPTNTTLNNGVSSLTKNLSSLFGGGGVAVSSVEGKWQTAGTVIWDNTEANGYTITEAGYLVQWASSDQGTPSTHQYGTISQWSPYNDPVNQIMAHAVFPDFVKTSSNWLRLTFTCKVWTGSRRSSSNI